MEGIGTSFFQRRPSPAWSIGKLTKIGLFLSKNHVSGSRGEALSFVTAVPVDELAVLTQNLPCVRGDIWGNFVSWTHVEITQGSSWKNVQRCWKVRKEKKHMWCLWIVTPRIYRHNWTRGSSTTERETSWEARCCGNRKYLPPFGVWLL